MRNEERDSEVIDQVRWHFPGFLARSGEREGLAVPATPDLPSPDAFRRDASALKTRREAAKRHAERPFASSATEAAEGESHARKTAGRPSALNPEVARRVGIAVHAALEQPNVHAGPSAGEHELLLSLLGADLAGARLQGAVEAAEGLLTRFRSGPLAGRLAELEGRVVARELPVLLATDRSDPAAPVSHLSGRIDMVYRDPLDEAWVIVDYKTDDVESEAECEERAEHYRSQGRAYAAALRSALALEAPPRFELWFLASGTVVPVDVESAAAPPSKKS